MEIDTDGGGRVASSYLRVTRQKGLTLVETLMAMVMLSLLIVGLLGLLGSLLVSSTKVSDSSAGTYAGQYLLDQAAAVGSPPTPTGGATEGVRSLRTHESKYPVDFHYRLEWTKIGNLRRYTPTGGETRDSQFGTRLFHVRVTVWWMVDKPTDGRAEGGGKRSVSLERLIKVAKP